MQSVTSIVLGELLELVILEKVLVQASSAFSVSTKFKLLSVVSNIISHENRMLVDRMDTAIAESQSMSQAFSRKRSLRKSYRKHNRNDSSN